jgi:hypothetical protein
MHPITRYLSSPSLRFANNIALQSSRLSFNAVLGSNNSKTQEEDPMERSRIAKCEFEKKDFPTSIKANIAWYFGDMMAKRVDNVACPSDPELALLTVFN